MTLDFNKSIFPACEGAYIVGGSLRDLLLHRSPSDYDIAVMGDAEAFARELAAKTHGHMVELGKDDQRIIRVVSGDAAYDVSQAAGTAIEEDLARRDFTINAMACNLSSGSIVDNFGGMEDIRARKIRMVSRKAFRRDPLRLLRAFRIAACLEFGIETQTESMIQEDAGLIRNAAGERIREELLKLFGVRESHRYLNAMADTGLLFAIFPEMESLKGCAQNDHHSEDAFEHTMEAYRHLESALDDIARVFPEASAEAGGAVTGKEAALLKCSVLLHDIGKPSARTVDEEGRTHFYGHEGQGAQIVKGVLERLRFSVAEGLFVTSIVRHHMRPLLLYLAFEGRSPSRSSLTRFFIACGDLTPHVLLHSVADAMGKGERQEEGREPYLTFANAIMKAYFTDYSPKASSRPLLTGKDLIREFDLTPSPRFKAILDFVEEARLMGRITSREEALKLAGDFIEQ